jgi:hypothetical protein
MSSFSLWGGLGEPGEAYVKYGGKESTLGAPAPTRGASPTIVAVSYDKKGHLHSSPATYCDDKKESLVYEVEVLISHDLVHY